MKAAKFDWMGVFSYSDEEGSGAFHLGEKVPKRTIEARRRTLMRLQKSISRRSKAGLVGRSFDLLVQGESEETPLLWEGRTEHQAPEIDGKVFINDFGPFERLEPGVFIAARLPTRMTTTWWLKSPGNDVGWGHEPIRKQKENPPLSNLPAARNRQRSGFSFLQRALQNHRPGEMGERRIPDFLSGARS